MRDVTLSVVKNRWPAVSSFVLGGVDEEGNYKENSFAKLVKGTLGIYIYPKQWVEIAKTEGFDGDRHVNIKIEGTKFITWLYELNTLTSHILRLIDFEEEKENLRREVVEKVETLKKDPDKFIETIFNIYRLCEQLSANYNQYTFFALSTRTITYKVIKQKYPKLIENLENMTDFLGLDKIFEPDVSDAEKRRDYTLYSHRVNGLLDTIFKINEKIWKYFSDYHSRTTLFGMLVKDPKDLGAEFYKNALELLSKIGWKFPNYIETSCDSRPFGPNYDIHIYEISGPLLVKERVDWLTTRGYHYVYENNCAINLFNLFDDLAPALFLGSLKNYYYSTYTSEIHIFTFEVKINQNELSIWEGKKFII